MNSNKWKYFAIILSTLALLASVYAIAANSFKYHLELDWAGFLVSILAAIVAILIVCLLVNYSKQEDRIMKRVQEEQDKYREETDAQLCDMFEKIGLALDTLEVKIGDRMGTMRQKNATIVNQAVVTLQESNYENMRFVYYGILFQYRVGDDYDSIVRIINAWLEEAIRLDRREDIDFMLDVLTKEFLKTGLMTKVQHKYWFDLYRVLKDSRYMSDPIIKLLSRLQEGKYDRK